MWISILQFFFIIYSFSIHFGLLFYIFLFGQKGNSSLTGYSPFRSYMHLLGKLCKIFWVTVIMEDTWRTWHALFYRLWSFDIWEEQWHLKLSLVPKDVKATVWIASIILKLFLKGPKISCLIILNLNWEAVRIHH